MCALELLDRAGLAFTSRWLHILVGITWIGLLYYFNLVQVPAFAEMSAGARTEAIESSRSARCGGSGGRPSPRCSPA